MTDRNDLNSNLARDYLQGASNFIWAAEKICANTEENSAEWLFKLENPVTFLLGHASELILKAGLAKQGLLGNLEHSHKLNLLVKSSQQNSIPLDPDFCDHLNIINDNFENYDHRYQRSFSGFPDDKHDRLMERINENTPEARKELRKYGLVGKRVPNLLSFLDAAQTQLQTTVSWMENINENN